jgi:hypothetical protein
MESIPFGEGLMKIQKLFVICLFAPLVFLTFAQLSAASETTVIGQNISAVDPSNVQAAINASEPRDTVILRGTFDFGTDGFITIDKEGLIIKGEIDSSGNRETNSPAFWLTTVAGGDTPFRSVNVGITIQDLFFNNTRRCVIFPNGSTGGDIVLRNNRVENVIPTLASASLLQGYRNFFGYFATFVYTAVNPLANSPADLTANPIMGNLTIENNYVDLLHPTQGVPDLNYSMGSAVAINLAAVKSTGTKLYVEIKNNVLKNPGFAGISFIPAKSGSGPVEYHVESNTIEQPLMPYSTNYPWGTINPEGRGGGIHSFSSANPSNVAIVKNNHMKNCGWGLLLGGMDSSTFDSNIIENIVPTTGNYVSPIIFFGFNNSAVYQNTNNIISNNTITGTNQYGVGVSLAANTPPVSNNIFVGNDFSGFAASKTQIYLSGANRNSFYGNKLGPAGISQATINLSKAVGSPPNAPAGSAAGLDGKEFFINDGINGSVWFEFDSDGSWSPANIRIMISGTDTAAMVATNIRAAINSVVGLSEIPGASDDLLFITAEGTGAAVSLIHDIPGTIGNNAAYSLYTAPNTAVQFGGGRGSEGNYFGPDNKNGIPGNIIGALGPAGIAGIIDNGYNNSFVKNDFTMSGIRGKKYSDQVCVALSATSHDDFVDESGMFPPGTGGAKDQVTNLGTNNRVVGHPAKSVPDSKDRGIGQRLRALEEKLAAQ